jgi:hypothetical protein
VNWPASLRDFDEGVEALQSDAVSWGSNVKNYADLIGRSELGSLFCTRRGVLTFRDRNVAVGAVPGSVLTDDDGNPLTDDDGGVLLSDSGRVFADDGTGTPYQGISATVGSELLFARVGVDREGGTNQTEEVADLTAWQELYGPAIRSLKITELLLADDSQSLAMAGYLLSLYDTPRYRISELTIDLTPLSATEQTSVATIDVTDVVSATLTPNGVGDPIMQTLFVQGVRHTIGVDRHVVTLSLIDMPFPYFRIGDASYGVIGEDVIGF